MTAWLFYFSHMVAQMYELNSRVGYHLLFYLAATANQSDSDRLSQASSTQTATSTDPKDVYVDVMLNSLDEEISTALVKDMHMAAKHDMNLFMKLLPYIFTNFSQGQINCISSLETAKVRGCLKF